MLYKPSYCCNCGDKVERAEWRIWDSRRFCQLCETEHKGSDMAQRAVVAIGLVFGLFGFSMLVWPEQQARSKETEASTMPRTLKSSQKNLTQSVQPVVVEERSVEEKNQVIDKDPDVVEERKEQTQDSLASSDTGLYYCGATTKKGTPCSRRVKKKGRCWQHEGIP